MARGPGIATTPLTFGRWAVTGAKGIAELGRSERWLRGGRG